MKKKEKLKGLVLDEILTDPSLELYKVITPRENMRFHEYSREANTVSTWGSHKGEVDWSYATLKWGNDNFIDSRATFSKKFGDSHTVIYI